MCIIGLGVEARSCFTDMPLIFEASKGILIFPLNNFNECNGVHQGHCNECKT